MAATTEATEVEREAGTEREAATEAAAASEDGRRDSLAGRKAAAVVMAMVEAERVTEARATVLVAAATGLTPRRPS